MKAAKRNVSCSDFKKVRLTEAMSEEIVEMVDLRKSWDLKWRFQEGKVEKREAMERKCICGDHRKTVSVHPVDLFVELARECEAWQKIISVSLCANKHKRQKSQTT
ncbi:hypothetical protein T08_11341 [Trichinella sp. T8]|nr:hypothetical protein T08_11341 [Trichinella sp. T8]